MKKEDFKEVLKFTFNKEVNKDATPDGDQHVKYFSHDGAKKKVFLGGTWNGSTWRDELIPLLGKLEYFNPVVEDWNAEAQAAEELAKVECGIHLYVITPAMTGVFSIAEVVKSAVINPKGTVLAVMTKDGKKKFDNGQLKSLAAVMNLVSGDFGAATILMDGEDGMIRLADYLSNDIKQGFANTYVIQMQGTPLKYGGVNGIQVYDLISLCRSIVRHFQSKFGCEWNIKTMKALKSALRWQEARTEDRKLRKVEGYAKQ